MPAFSIRVIDAKISYQPSIAQKVKVLHSFNFILNDRVLGGLDGQYIVIAYWQLVLALLQECRPHTPIDSQLGGKQKAQITLKSFLE